MKKLDPAITKQFTCKQCGHCCRIPNGIVRLNDAMIENIAAYLLIPVEEFIDKHTDVSPDRACLILKNTQSGICVYLNENGGCDIYPVRPEQCRSFPFDWINDDSMQTCAGLKALHDENVL